jgi:outer membrane receptor protein involved in Fe transport
MTRRNARTISVESLTGCIRAAIQTRGFTFTLLALLVAISGVRAHGQTTFGSVLGVVTDASGASIPSATVSLTNVGTDDKRTALTDGGGNYQFPNLQPGMYSVDFEKTGFNHLKRESVTVVVQAAVRIDAKLKIGDVSQTVTIDTVSPIIETQPGSLGQLIEGKQVQETPLNGRNVFNLLTLAPGVVPQGSTGGNPLGNQSGGTFTNNTGFGNYQIGGGMANESAFYLDGVPLNTAYINSPALVPTQDAIQEFRVDSNAVSAEFGRFAGGVVNMASRSGTDSFHGSAYEYIRNKVLNANTFFNNRSGIPVPAFTQNQYGVSLGGPIKHEKIFGFFSWEAFSFRKGNPTTLSVPLPAFYSGDFSALCSTYTAAGVCAVSNGTQLYDPQTTCGIAGTPACPAGQTTTRQPFAFNKIPLSRLDPASAQFFKYYGAPNQAATVNSAGLPINNFAANVSLGGNTQQYNGRIDWNVSPRQRIFARYSYWSGTSLPSDPFHTHFGGLNSYTGSQNFVIGDTYTINSKTIADIRVSYLRGRDGFTPEQLGTNLSLFGPAWAALAPQVTLPVAPLATNGWGAFNGTDNRAIMNDYTASGALTKIMGKHTLKMGGEIRRNEWNFAQSSTAAGSFAFDQGFTAQLNPAANNAQVANTGYAGASFFLGNPASGSAASIAFTDAIQYYVGAYVQDTFKVGRKLTLTPGARWEYPEAFTEKNNRLTVLQPTATDPLGAVVGLPLTGQLALVASPAYPDRQLIQNHFKLFSPRVNIAYNANPTTSVRAGYGLSWIPPDMINYSESPFQSPVNAATSTIVSSVGGTSEILPAATFGNPFPTGLVPPIGHNPAQLSVFEGQSILSPIPTEHFGYAQQWNLEVQQEITPSLLADFGYAGSKGTHLSYSTAQLNQLPDSLLSMGTALNTQVANPFYGHIASGLLANPTVARAQLLRPHPQFQSFQDTAAQIGDSHWNALEVRVIKRFKTGGVLSGAYTWSKLISNTDTLTSWLENHGTAGVQDWNNLRGEKSLASFDVPHRFVASYVLDLPFGTNRHFLANAGPFVNRVVGGWSVSGITTLQSGFPLAFSTATNQTGSQGGGSRPNVVSANKQIKGPAQNRLTQWFNTAAFAAPPAFTFGNESRTDSTLRDDGVANYDFTLGKAVPISERVSFQFKTEVFNLFNRVQFADPGTSVGSSTYGVVSAVLGNPRLIQFSGRLSF